MNTTISDETYPVSTRLALDLITLANQRGSRARGVMHDYDSACVTSDRTPRISRTSDSAAQSLPSRPIQHPIPIAQPPFFATVPLVQTFQHPASSPVVPLFPIGLAYNTVQMHPDLAPNPYDMTRPPLRWNLSRLPSTTARGVTACRNPVSPRFHDTATIPPLNRFNITADHGLGPMMDHLHWGAIVVESTPAITMKDVLDAIYMYFQMPVTRSEFNYMTAHLGSRYTDRATVNFYQRIQLLRHPAYAMERSQGLRRIDVVGPYKYFQGLMPVLCVDGLWTLHLKLGCFNNFP